MNYLDTRQYRSDRPGGDKWGVICDTLGRKEADVLGATQEQRLLNGLSASTARWIALVQ